MSVYLACKQAIQRARNLGPISLNRVPDLHARGMPSARVTPRGGLNLGTRGEQLEYRRLAAEMELFRTAIRNQVDFTADLEANAEAITRQGLLVERFGAFGNCGELSAVAFRYLRQQPIFGRVGFFGWAGGNHEFVVAGLPATLARHSWQYDPLEAPAEWGKEAVWCDPWTTNCFDTWKKNVWSTHTPQILKKTDPRITTYEAKRATRFTLLAVAVCGRH